MSTAFTVWITEPDERRQPGRPKRRREYNIKTNLR